MIAGIFRMLLTSFAMFIVAFFLIKTRDNSDLYGSYHQAGCVAGVTAVIFVVAWVVKHYCDRIKKTPMLAVFVFMALGSVITFLGVALAFAGANMTQLGADLLTTLLLLICIVGVVGRR